MRVLEFYCGIGGFHYSILLSGCQLEVVQAFDIHEYANHTYHFNFQSKVNSQNIESLSIKDIDSYEADVWMMSPPCQPYTRQKEALRRGSTDPRAKSFLHLLDILPQLKRQPSHILIENVVGFESSDTRTMLIEVLSRQKYTWQEFHLTPVQFGIPNQRMRYYLLAKKHPHSFLCSNTALMKEIPGSHFFQQPLPMTPLSHYLANLDLTEQESFMVPEKVLMNSGMLFDIVYPSHERSCCFTRAYTHKVEGAGSVLQLASKDTPIDVSNPASLIPLHLRYFTPMEVARLHGFPSDFAYPADLTKRQCYRLIGNSLNVVVVAELVKYLMAEQNKT